jgi:COP9 signalosome complex subunit 6
VSLFDGAVIEKESGVSAKLHPLVIMSMSDHFTRQRLSAAPQQRVVGALMGEQKGRVVDIAGSFELIVTAVDGKQVLDQAFLIAKVENCERDTQESYPSSLARLLQLTDPFLSATDKKVFPSEEFLGWYFVGSGIDAANDALLHKQFLEVNENPLLLVLDAAAARSASQKELPITLYESELRLLHEAPIVLFNKVLYQIETNEAERIAVDHVAHLSTAGDAAEGSQSTAHLASLHNAVQMLRERLVQVEQFLESELAAASDGRPLDLVALRRIGALTRALPALATDRFCDEYYVSFNDGALLSYMTAITKTLDGANHLVEAYNQTAEAKAGQRRLRGM